MNNGWLLLNDDLTPDLDLDKLQEEEARLKAEEEKNKGDKGDNNKDDKGSKDDDDDNDNPIHIDPIVDPKEEDINPFKIIAEELGITFEGEDAEEFKKVIKDQAKLELLEEMGIDSPEVVSILEYLAGGGDIKDYIETIQSIPNISKLTPEQKYTQYLKHTTNFSDQKIAKLVKQAVDTDELDEEISTVDEYFANLEKTKVKELAEELEAERKAAEEDAKKVQALRQKLVNNKDLMGHPITNNKEFEKYYFNRTETVTTPDKKVYKISKHEKAMYELRNDLNKRTEYEMLIAYLNFTGFKVPQDITKQNNLVTDLKSKLRGSLGKGSVLIDKN